MIVVETSNDREAYPATGSTVRSGAAAAQVTRSKWDAETATDMLFALASVASITGLNLPGVRAPVFVIFVVLTTLVSAKKLMQLRTLGVFVPPLLVFMCIHLLFAFRISAANGLVFVLQALVVGLFVWAFVTRYSQVSMRRYLTFTGIGMVGLLTYVLIYHFSLGKFAPLKLLDDPKAVFSLLPVMLLVLHFSKARSSKYLGTVLLPLFVALVLLSGERKAYILLALVAPFLVDFRSIGTYLALFVAAAAVPLAMTLDQSGYVERQVSTLGSLAQGEVQETVSNEKRAGAISFAQRLFEENPIIGVGTNGYTAVFDREFRESVGPHNEWVRVAAENGILGLFFYAATVAWGFVGLFRSRVGKRVRSPREKAIAFALFLTLVMYLTFEALDLIVILAFCLTPMVQYLRLDPHDRHGVVLRHESVAGAAGWPQSGRFGGAA
jgi:O-antigen ligase